MPSRRRNAPSVPACLHRSASASNRRFSLPENLRRLAIATTSGSRRAASGETVSPVALRAPSATASPEEPDNPFKEDLNNEVMCMSYLYSKLPEAGVPLLIGTGGIRKDNIEGDEGFNHQFREGLPSLRFHSHTRPVSFGHSGEVSFAVLFPEMILANISSLKKLSLIHISEPTRRTPI